MNPIFTALANGYTEDEVLRQVIKAVPKLAPKIKKALSTGYSQKKILDFLSNDMQRANDQVLQVSNKIDARQKRRQDELTKSLLGKGLKYGSLAFGAGMLARVAPSLLARLGPNIARNAGALSPELEALGVQQGPNLLGQAPTGGITPPSPLSEKILEGINLKGLSDVRKGAVTKLMEQLKNLESQGKNTSDSQYRNLVTRIREILQGPGPTEFEETERFQEEYGKERPIQLGGPEETITESIEEKPIEISKKEKPKIEKGSEVITNSGEIGKIEDLPGKTAKINVGGEKKIVKTDDIESSPITEDELANLYEELLRGIESYTGQQVSRNVNLAGYDADNNELTYTPHSGDTYVYDDIPPDIIDELLSLMPRKTTGENYIGAWEADTESPIGAAISALIQRLIKERGRGKEYTRKYKSIYDALKPAKEALKAKKKREKSAERKKRK